MSGNSISAKWADEWKHRHPEPCEKCGELVSIGDHPFCPHGRGQSHRPFKSFSIEHEGRTYEVSGIQSASKMERESMARYRNGEGAPIALRDFHQDHSHKGNVFGRSPQVPHNNRNSRGQKFVTKRGTDGS